MADNNAMEIRTIENDRKIQEYTQKLRELRKNGETKVTDTRIDITALRKNQLIEVSEKEKAIAEKRRELEEAKAVAAKNKAEVNRISKEAVKYVNAVSKEIEAAVNAKENKRMAGAKAYYAREVAEIKANGEKRKADIQNRMAGSDPKVIKSELSVASYETRSALFDAKSRFQSEINKSKAAKNQAYVDHIQKNRELRNGKTNFGEDMKMKWMNYKTNFRPSSFLLANGLYIAIIIFFIICIIIAPMKVNSNLLTLPNIFTILEQCSTRMFYALGVAGLILLAGTDLSIGRMVALGSVTTGLILHPGMNIVSFMGMGPWDFSAIPMALRVVMALVLSVLFCSIFSAFAGFFSAKLKMHPFISTMSTQLIIYGVLFFGTSGTPVGSIDRGIKELIGGRWVIGMLGNGQLITFPKLIIPAIIAIIVAWLIWNKTTFGKNMYAVGGNAEAAAVSGISVFWVTLGVFIMAGVFYGCGSFLEAFRANASAGTGQGYEMDAIAACVVGGISFNGGIGKIGGAAIGVVIFTSLTYCLTFLGIDTNLQFVFKGFIILAAVSLDSIKYLKKK
ncbi:MAG: galactoside ABC transporter permease [Spirochaetes bacterium]|uniref:Galactoside ABC transporter permease n=1 Tax=Candidatus Ornithospirochaeta stercoripullorum TaxID=2840899 RepID=A0A9D9DZP4_9SPIO|nr:galactoside ABC transporter permease [Candidatus Ornithospirochaeta stercoripullorum]